MEDDTRKLIFAASSCGYEDGWTMKIFEQDDKLWYHYCWTCEGYSDDDTIEITQERALELMFECAEHEDEVPEWFF
jgi:hypothetical protein